MMVRATITDRAITATGFQFVRHNARNETVPCHVADEAAELEDIVSRSAPYGTCFMPHGDTVMVTAS
jgi:hypothetical protein